jgi:YfiH family protein
MTPFITPQWAVPTTARAAFTLRSGGASQPPWATLNLGAHVGDDPTAVAQNRLRVATALALPSEPQWLAQVHGTDVVEFDSGLSREAPTQRPTADAAMTRERGVVLAIQVADCLPVLLVDDAATVVAAAHAGWRGLAAGVLERTVERMALPGGQLQAWLGPCIGPAHFEVGAEVVEAFAAAGDPPQAFVPLADGKWRGDLLHIARHRLAALGVGRVTGGSWCTVADPIRFFSHRRDRQTGRMAALLWLP